MIEKSMVEHTRTATESLQFIFEGFNQQTLEKQQEFLEFFERIIKPMRNEPRKKILMKFSRLLKKAMNRKLENWLEAEMKGER